MNSQFLRRKFTVSFVLSVVKYFTVFTSVLYFLNQPNQVGCPISYTCPPNGSLSWIINKRPNCPLGRHKNDAFYLLARMKIRWIVVSVRLISTLMTPPQRRRHVPPHSSGQPKTLTGRVSRTILLSTSFFMSLLNFLQGGNPGRYVYDKCSFQLNSFSISDFS